MKMMRDLRKSKGLTMKELGTRIGVSESAISQYETGKREADFETLLKIGEVLGCSIDYLLRGECDEKKLAFKNEDELDSEMYELFSNLTPKQMEAAKTYIRFLKSQE